MTLAEIVADIERQARNYGTVILPTDDAMRLLAVAEAALKIRKTLDVLEYAGTSPRLSADIAAFDALAARGGE